ncbi:hypothetical protein Ami103574_12450 [Aminipila butyrica]|uniref:Uncharacterized protein n=1 Tax=Aminipila butyrica TaxID=433296 RepID=A0A858BXA6_9FIRM|nr:hypothetical protein [Aminipila butyrica]QIB70052.1 hypothetical protein Ami103574_12450 [Aminipila butyrica]
MKKRKIDGKTVLVHFVLWSLVASVIFVVIKLVLSPSEAAYAKQRSDYVLMLLQCIIGIFALMLPSILNHRWKIELPSFMLVLYVLFLYGAIYLGEVRSFYYRIPGWDTILHTFSGAMLGALGFSIISLLNAKHTWVNLSPIFVSLFAFCFAVTVGCIWEIYEFSADAILSTNMQKFMLEDGTLLVGRAALTDTMKDLIVDILGAFVMSTVGYLSQLKESGFLKRFVIKN